MHKLIKLTRKLTLVLTLPLVMAGCQPTSITATNAAGSCTTLNDFDLRPSRLDTANTKRVLYGLQAVKDECNKR